MLEEEVHLAVVGVGDDVKLNLGTVFLKSVERAKEPVAAFDALRVTFVVGCRMHPNRVGQRVADNQRADLSRRLCCHVGFKDPMGFGCFDGPLDGIPTTIGVAVFKDKVVGMDVELRCGDDPVWCWVFEIGRGDFLGVGSVVQVQVEIKYTVAA